jgi:hypothetical protein
MPVPQGDLKLLDSDIAKELLNSTIPARMAYIATDGTPRISATWFHWEGQELVMGTFIAAPHVRHPAARLKALRANPAVAISVDTDKFPPRVLEIRGRVSIKDGGWRGGAVCKSRLSLFGNRCRGLLSQPNK